MITQKLLFTWNICYYFSKIHGKEIFKFTFVSEIFFLKTQTEFRWSLIELRESGFGPLRWAAGSGAKRRENSSAGWKQRCRQVSNETAEYHTQHTQHMHANLNLLQVFSQEFVVFQKLHIFLLDTVQSKPVSEKMVHGTMQTMITWIDSQWFQFHLLKSQLQQSNNRRAACFFYNTVN